MSSESSFARNRKVVVKIGGSTLGAHDTTLEDLVSLQRQGAIPLVVHGGGAVVTDWLKRQGVQTHFVRGLRVTDEESLQVVTAVLAGLVNKVLVAGILTLGGRAVGLSGIDGAIIEGRIQNPDLGYVGEADKVNLEPIELLIAAGYIPVVSTIGFNPVAGEGPNTLNLNADTVAGELAAAWRADKLVFLTDVAGVQDGAGQVIRELSAGQATALIEGGTASGGMIPKLEACLRAASEGTESWIVDGRSAHMLLSALSPDPVGTRVG